MGIRSFIRNLFFSRKSKSRDSRFKTENQTDIAKSIIRNSKISADDNRLLLIPNVEQSIKFVITANNLETDSLRTEVNLRQPMENTLL